jgi:hypothetical protein
VKTSSITLLLGLLTALSVTLKLTGAVDTPWWWVLSPLWIGFAFVLCALFLFFIIDTFVAK